MFYIEKNKENNYVFHLKSDDKHIIASSKAYTEISEIKKEIDYIAKNTNLDRIYERKTNKSGQFYFNILDQSLKAAAASQLYNSKVGLENGIKAAKEFAKQHQIKKVF
ncbi:DUF1508 domain-containing protein [Aquimarina agarilytica]|uniref:DUF1508 domain-containing protein n=1 Tax=Aquimarina agarilytica TaxID=1087449 RepID=UPI0002885426|nr:DUF1508 domain-containing protein [Aquimarina agarilytica]